MSWEAQQINQEKITFEQYQKSGCPVCKTGEKEGYTLVQGNNETIFQCANCKVAYIVTN